MAYICKELGKRGEILLFNVSAKFMSLYFNKYSRIPTLECASMVTLLHFYTSHPKVEMRLFYA